MEVQYKGFSRNQHGNLVIEKLLPLDEKRGGTHDVMVYPPNDIDGDKYSAKLTIFNIPDAVWDFAGRKRPGSGVKSLSVGLCFQGAPHADTEEQALQNLLDALEGLETDPIFQRIYLLEDAT